jgi:hypothetical protein
VESPRSHSRVEKDLCSSAWITNDYDSRGPRITLDKFKEILDREGEGLPSRDQVKEKREQRLTQVGFCLRKPQESVGSYGTCCTSFSYGYAFTVQTVVYIHNSHEGESRMPRKACEHWSYNRSDLASLSEPLSWLHEP